jgi:2-C-methyl-D-erythritol 2,4-cyclodiphosphate synthase
MRSGLGYDIHRLIAGSELVLGGVQIPYEKGLLGHSDADVLVHAVCDALLGAAGLGDIGEHFPDTDPAYRGISSLKLLKRTCDLVAAKGWRVLNLDATVFAQAPRLTPYKAAIRQSLAHVMATAPERINIKAKTTEGLDSVGRGEGIAAMCIVTLGDISGGN